MGFLGVVKMLSIENNCDIFSIPFLVAKKKATSNIQLIGEERCPTSIQQCAQFTTFDYLIEEEKLATFDDDDCSQLLYMLEWKRWDFHIPSFSYSILSSKFVKIRLHMG